MPSSPGALVVTASLPWHHPCVSAYVSATVSAWSLSGLTLIACLFAVVHEIRGLRAVDSRVEAVRSGSASQLDQLDAEARERYAAARRWQLLTVALLVAALLLSLIAAVLKR